MKTTLLALLLFAVVLFVTVECKRSGTGIGDPKSAKGVIGKLRKRGKRRCFSCAVLCFYGKQLSLFPQLLLSEILTVFPSEMQQYLASVLHSQHSSLQLIC